MSFSSFSLMPALLKSLSVLSYQQPTEIQYAAIPKILDGKDILANAHTGSGKTAAFALPIIQELALAKRTSVLQALVLVPTRELAIQVHKSFVDFAKYSDISTACFYGGMKDTESSQMLERDAEILIATPGKLLNMLEQQSINVSHINYWVLDEADRMLDLGFQQAIKDIHAYFMKKPQTLFFSATLTDDIYALSDKYLQHSCVIDQCSSSRITDSISERIYSVDPEQRSALCSAIIQEHSPESVLIFTRTKHHADKLVLILQQQAIDAVAIHGDKTQHQREQHLEEFKQGLHQVLVATDVAARGIHIHDLKLVINYQLPFNAEDYVHRLGRTGRAGKSGLAISLVSDEERELLLAIEDFLNRPLMQQWYEGFEPAMDRKLNLRKKKKKLNKKQLRQQALLATHKRK